MQQASISPGTFWINSSFQDESHFHGNPELVDLAVPHACFLLDHMEAGYTAQSSVRARKAFLDSSIEAAVIFDTLATAIASCLNNGSKRAAAGGYGNSSHGLPLRLSSTRKAFSKACATADHTRVLRIWLRQNHRWNGPSWDSGPN